MNKINFFQNTDKWLRDKGLLPTNFDKNPKASEVPKGKKKKNPNIHIEPFIPKSIDRLPGNFHCAVKDAGNIQCGGFRCIAHVITRQDTAIKTEVTNRVFICKEHEIWFNKQDVRVWYRYVKEHFPEKFEAVKKRYQFVLAEYELFMEIVNE